MCIPKTRDMIIGHILEKMHEKFHKAEHPIDKFTDVIMAFKIFTFEFDYKDVFDFCEENNITLDSKIKQIYKKRKTSKFIMHLTHLYSLCYYQWRPPDIRDAITNFKGFNTGMVLNGPSGVGKSQILAYLHAWAKENNWVVVSVSSASKFTKTYTQLERHLTGLYLQHDFVREFLIDFKIINYRLLKDSPVDYTLFGKSDMAGNRDGDPEAVPVFWDKERDIYSDSWKKWIPKVPGVDLSYDYPDHHKRLYDIIQKPNNLLEIVTTGKIILKI